MKDPAASRGVPPLIQPVLWRRILRAVLASGVALLFAAAAPAILEAQRGGMAPSGGHPGGHSGGGAHFGGAHFGGGRPAVGGMRGGRFFGSGMSGRFVGVTPRGVVEPEGISLPSAPKTAVYAGHYIFLPPPGSPQAGRAAPLKLPARRITPASNFKWLPPVAPARSRFFLRAQSGARVSVMPVRPLMSFRFPPQRTLLPARPPLKLPSLASSPSLTPTPFASMLPQPRGCLAGGFGCGFDGDFDLDDGFFPNGLFLFIGPRFFNPFFSPFVPPASCFLNGITEFCVNSLGFFSPVGVSPFLFPFASFGGFGFRNFGSPFGGLGPFGCFEDCGFNDANFGIVNPPPVASSPELGPFSFENPFANPPPGQASEETPAMTIFVLEDGTSFGVTDYWLAGGRVHYITTYGAENSLGVEQLDWQKTVDENAGRGVPFTLRPQQ